jgi:pimeloyl-ACP methyl ester carboxylesterase
MTEIKVIVGAIPDRGAGTPRGLLMPPRWSTRSSRAPGRYESRLREAWSSPAWAVPGRRCPCCTATPRHIWRGTPPPPLAKRFSVVAADLPGYGGSFLPPVSSDHTAHAKPTLARDLVAAMFALGHDSFAVVGHDRGGRVAYRMALDFPEVVTHVVALDVVPTGEVSSVTLTRSGLPPSGWGCDPAARTTRRRCSTPTVHSSPTLSSCGGRTRRGSQAMGSRASHTFWSRRHRSTWPTR